MLKLDLLRLRQTKRACDISEGLLRENNRSGPHGANGANKVHVLDCFRKKF